METALIGPRQPIYSTILDLNRKILNFDVPLPWRMPTKDDEPSPPGSVDVPLARLVGESNRYISSRLCIVQDEDELDMCQDGLHRELNAIYKPIHQQSEVSLNYGNSALTCTNPYPQPTGEGKGF